MENFHYLSMHAAITIVILLLVSLLGSSQASAEEARIAVASNFADTARELAEYYERKSGHTITLAFSSTGKHFAQISNGAPYAAFLAADSRRPELLVEKGLALPGSRFTYAIGRLVLWSPRVGLVDANGSVLAGHDFRYLAIANPRLAPYGRAARQVLQRLGLWLPLQERMVRGENIGQAYHYVLSGNAELGFIARSQLVEMNSMHEGSSWLVPASMHDPIEQQAVLLRDTDAARGFFSFLRSEAARGIIRQHGYETP